jgi:DNA-binding XRE family transcriptional regulator
MKSSLPVLIPPVVAKSLAKFGQDLAMARRKRRLTIKMMAERIGVAPNTYRRIERGDPKASLGIYAMALYVLGFGGALGDVADMRRDDIGLLQDEERLPLRVRVKRNPTAQ